MNINTLLKYLFTVALIIALAGNTNAQQLSYVYIQGDKDMPFYVKVEGKMQARYSGNYCIIPKLHAGPLHIEILFQQNILPARAFTILVPENGYRGLLLDKQKDGYVLYDLQAKKYLDVHEEEK